MSIPKRRIRGVMVGIDIGKFRFECHIEGQSGTSSHANAATYFETFEQSLPDAVAWIVLEATGGYEKRLRRYLQGCGYRVHVAHPVRVRAFATAHGMLAKTDPIDAQVLSDYARAMAPFALQVETAERQQIQVLIRRRTQLVEQRKAETNRLDKTTEPSAIASLHRHMAWLDEELKLLEAELEAMLQTHPRLMAQVALYESVCGIGRQSSLTLLADLPELGQANEKALTALVGLAPYARDSSTLKKRRRIRGGRPTVRRVLYMAAISAIRYNPDLRPFYQRLRKRGKPGKVAVIAVMRKLLLVLNAVARRQTPWEPNRSAAMT